MARRGWWRINAIPLALLVVVAPAAALGILWSESTIVRDQSPIDSTPVVVTKGKTTELADTTWGPIRSGVIVDTEGLTPPPHTKVIAVAIPVDTDVSLPVRCESPQLVQQSTGRQWNEMSYELGLDYSSTENRECAFEATGPYEMINVFAVPEDVDGPFWVDVRLTGAGSTSDGSYEARGPGSEGSDEFVRFVIDPS
ncbi:hypothetical protein ACFVAE_13865 [Microbacterium sp. NPDC057659]|uniref:hypothetical protein n=1 Tax=Microbacterium sp. NPDC057659 TaxID=3346198 RepID=UPI00366F040A